MTILCSALVSLMFIIIAVLLLFEDYFEQQFHSISQTALERHASEAAEAVEQTEIDEIDELNRRIGQWGYQAVYFPEENPLLSSLRQIFLPFLGVLVLAGIAAIAVILLLASFFTRKMNRLVMEPVELPVGDFTVYAHTDGSLDDTTAPFYGKRDNFTIKKDAETKVGIQCEMMNTMFQLKYDPGFISMYRKWEITVTAGKHSKPYLFEKKDLNDTPQNPDPIYWYLGDEEVKNFIVEVQAWTQDGNIPVTATQSFSKDDQAAYTGGEAVSINMMPGSPDVSTEGTATIDINVTLFSPYEDINESIEIDGTPTDPTDPSEPDQEPDEPATGDGLPTLTFPQTTYTLPADASGVDSDVKIASTAEGGIQNIKVQIVGGGSFATIASGLGTFDLMNCGDLAGTITSLVPTLEMPTPGITEYTFPVGGFFNILQMLCASDPKPVEHTFNITVTDANGSTDGSLKIVITE